MTLYPEAMAILKEFGVEVVSTSAHLRPGQTKAVASLQKIINARGYDHGRLIVMTWKETMLQRVIFDRPTMWAMSDVIMLVERNYPDLLSNRVSDWFQFFDGLRLEWLQEWARDVEGILPRRYAVAGQVYERIKRVFGIEQGDLLDDRRRIA
jgi:hypothetical protein